MHKELNNLKTDTQKKAAVKAKLRVRKKILGQKANTPSAFVLTAKAEQFPLTELVQSSWIMCICIYIFIL